MAENNRLVTNLKVKTFYQPGGPGQKRYFYATGSNPHFLDGGMIPTQGDIQPHWIPDPRRPGRRVLAAQTYDAPELPALDLIFREQFGGIPLVLTAPECEFNLYEVRSDCADLSDLYRGFKDFVLIFSLFKFTGMIDIGTRTSAEDDNPLEDSTEATGVSIYPAGALSFGEEGETSVVVEVIDAVAGQNITCADCGIPNDGSQVWYALTRANVGSPSAPGQVIWTVDGWITSNTSQITGIGASAEPTWIEIAGNVLMVGTNGTSTFYTTLNTDTGAPGTWSSITQPAAFNDCYVKTPNDIYFVGAAGRIYRSIDATAAATEIHNASTTDVYQRVHGRGEVIVAVGDNGRVTVSRNAGLTWATVVAPAAATLNAVQVLGDRTYLVGTSTGRLAKTRDAGTNWSFLATPFDNTGAILDVVAASDEVIWISQTVSGVARLVTTLDGGFTWAADNMTNRITNWPSFQRARRLAIPRAKPAIDVNYLLVCGLALSGTDGVLILGGPTILP